jgi:hypothetical protein
VSHADDLPPVPEHVEQAITKLMMHVSTRRFIEDFDVHDRGVLSRAVQDLLGSVRSQIQIAIHQAQEPTKVLVIQALHDSRVILAANGLPIPHSEGVQCHDDCGVYALRVEQMTLRHGKKP